ncbi:SseB family protein [Oceaniglobus roseus]|uniref:SseB family protein n=1 Tax=Oceaniglobus roseus TaxID=1737570 RepID=UPI000C7EBF48|nr:SseB family protein [Kandeliimicrobium roseum]
MTPLDRAHAAMEAAPEDDAARLRFYERLADGELFLLLARDSDGETLDPDVFDTADGRFVLVFDREDRLAAFTGRPAPYAALSGRSVIAMLAGQGLGLALNPEAAPSATLLGAEAVDWLHATLARVPDTVETRPEEVSAPRGLPEVLLGALDTKLATARGLASSAYLAGVRYDGGGQGHLLAFVGALPGAEPALARAAGEALTFSGIEAGTLDVAFLAAADPLAARLARVGLRFDIPKAEAAAPVAPGMDPERPPKLR